MMENITVTDSRVYSFLVLYEMHTTFFKRAIDGITDTDAHQRMQTQANHIAWLAGSLVQQRFELGEGLGIEDKQEADDLFKEHKGIQDNVTYPSLSTYLKDWERISPLLKDALSKVSTEKLNSTFEMMPGMSFPYFDLIAFDIYREANCIGQIALWRRLLGYEPMKYM